MTVAELTDDEIASRLAALTSQPSPEGGGLSGGAVSAGAPQGADSLLEGTPTALSNPKSYRFVRPLTEAADNLIEYLQNTDGRIMLGLPDIDVMTRGFGPGELVYMTGFSASGKTQTFLTMIVNNRDRRFVLITYDEPAELVLTKLCCLRTGSNAERMEERVKAGDQDAINRIRRIAREDFKNLIVIDESIHLKDYSAAIAEAEQWWGAPVEGVGIDYLELVRCDDTEVEKKSQSLKGWASGQNFPTICIHQGSRGNAGGGQKLTMRSMKYGGEQEATFVLGVRRQRDDEDLDEYTRKQLEDTVDISVIKSKRPPCKLGEHTFYLDPNCGLILPLSHRPEPATGLAAVRKQQVSQGQQDIYGGEVA